MDEATTVTVTVTETASVTATVAEPSAGLPRPVAATRDALLAAARTGDYENLRPLLGNEFSYSFGGPVEGGPIAHWQAIEANVGQSPIRILAGLLELPPTLHGGVYVWPFAFDKARADLTAYERGLLRSVGGADLSDDYGEGVGYLGWRAGIEPDGDWIFFIAGD